MRRDAYPDEGKGGCPRMSFGKLSKRRLAVPLVLPGKINIIAAVVAFIAIDEDKKIRPYRQYRENK
jgi:hypothetical protein